MTALVKKVDALVEKNPAYQKAIDEVLEGLGKEQKEMYEDKRHHPPEKSQDDLDTRSASRRSKKTESKREASDKTQDKNADKGKSHKKDGQSR